MSSSVKVSVDAVLVYGEERIEKLIAQRLEARANKNWAESDRIRDELAEQGVVLEDSADGTTWRRE